MVLNFKRMRNRLKKRYGADFQIMRVGAVLLFPGINRMIIYEEPKGLRIIEMDSELFPGVKRMRRRIEEIELLDSGYQYAPGTHVPRKKKTPVFVPPDYTQRELSQHLRAQLKKYKLIEVAPPQGRKYLRTHSWLAFSIPLLWKETPKMEDVFPKIMQRVQELKPGLVPSMVYFDLHDLIMMIGPVPVK